MALEYKSGLNQLTPEAQVPNYANPGVPKKKQPADPTAYVDPYARAIAQDQNLLRSFKGSSELTGRIKANQAKSNERRGLFDAIQNQDKYLADEQGLLRSEAGQALGEGLRNTRENFNSRGMLYSGLRQGGEQNLRSQVASSLAQQESGAARDSKNKVSAYKNQMASIGLKSAQQAQERASLVVENNMRNQVARLQALQQFGKGVGYAVGAAYGSRGERDNSPDRLSYGNQFISSGVE